ncbi:hypothetical protein [Geminicoccus flavidas]|uniref:hypothetical protein n=1 Tax=Geminicoccus flavidas TaxID=2506407 RepID=UPI001359B7C3|nr:hypothetical protein [Geminicoccus flavidas]
MWVQPVRNIVDAVRLVAEAWPLTVEECRSALGGELHYQAIAYHCLRRAACRYPVRHERQAVDRRAGDAAVPGS